LHVALRFRLIAFVQEQLLKPACRARWLVLVTTFQGLSPKFAIASALFYNSFLRRRRTQSVVWRRQLEIADSRFSSAKAPVSII